MLVCGLTSLGAEELKELRRAVKEFGFSCVMEMGWLQFISIDNKGDWNSLFKLLQIEGSIVPLYFQEGNRVLDLEYGKYCTETNAKQQLCNIILLGWAKILTSNVRFNTLTLMYQKFLGKNDKNV